MANWQAQQNFYYYEHHDSNWQDYQAGNWDYAGNQCGNYYYNSENQEWPYDEDGWEKILLLHYFTRFQGSLSLVEIYEMFVRILRIRQLISKNWRWAGKKRLVDEYDTVRADIL